MLDSSDLPGAVHNGPGGKTSPGDQDRLEPIAIVGYSFRFPGDATDSKAFWNMMMEKRCAMSDTPEDRISISQWKHADGRRRGQVRINLKRRQ